MGSALTAEQVAQLVTFIAPGYVARAVYRLRIPDRERQQFTLLVASVVLSLPLVALAGALARGTGVNGAATVSLPYVALLLGISVVAGYLASLLRTADRVRGLLLRLGLSFQPESSIYSMLRRLPPDATVSVEFLDGRKLSGTPAAGPGSAGDDIAELLITHPAWWDAGGQDWLHESGTAVIVPLSQVHSVTLDRAPV